MLNLSQETPQPVEVNGKDFRCLVCSNDQFVVRKAQMNQALTTFFNLDWTDKSATCLVCTECTYVHWFLGR